MKQLIEHINSRNRMLPQDILLIKNDLQKVFEKNILSAGVLQPGYFNDFHSILQYYRNNGSISRYMISEEEYTDDGRFYKIPVIDLNKSDDPSNLRIFLSPV